MTVDPVTLEVLRNGLAAVAEEMNANLIRTAYSPNIKERRDCSCALFDADGAMIAQAENIPVHLGAMPFSVAAAVDEFAVETLRPGDAVVLNDPYRGGAHLPDLTFVSPVFVEGALFAFAANRAHHADIGGATAGSVAADATSIFEEGLRIPPVRLVRNGAVVEDVMAIVLANTRAPRERRGDLRAQQAANETGRRRVGELVERHGRDTVAAGLEAIVEYSERRMRAELATIPDGTYAFEDVLEDDGRGNEDLSIHATIAVEGSDVTVDFSQSAPQTTGALNAVYAVTVSATYYALRCLTDPDIPPNAGCYRPIEVVAPAGTIVNAEPPAPVVGGNLETSQRVVDVLFGALADHAPAGAVAASQGTMNNLTFGGVDPRTDEAYTFYETIAGGGGGRTGKDGMDGIQVHMTNTLNTPAEVLQTAYPLAVRRYELRPDSGGAGAFRGGLGIRRDIELRGPAATCSLLGERRRRRPHGLAGGRPGAAGDDRLIVDGEEREIPAKSTHELEAGDIVSVRTPGGGGLGDPVERDDAAIRADVRLGKLTPAAVRDLYGLDLDGA